MSMVSNCVVECEGLGDMKVLVTGVYCRGIFTRHDGGQLKENEGIKVSGTCPQYEKCPQSLWTYCRDNGIPKKRGS